MIYSSGKAARTARTGIFSRRKASSANPFSRRSGPNMSTVLQVNQALMLHGFALFARETVDEIIVRWRHATAVATSEAVMGNRMIFTDFTFAPNQALQASERFRQLRSHPDTRRVQVFIVTSATADDGSPIFRRYYATLILQEDDSSSDHYD